MSIMQITYAKRMRKIAWERAQWEKSLTVPFKRVKFVKEALYWRFIVRELKIGAVA